MRLKEAISVVHLILPGSMVSTRSSTLGMQTLWFSFHFHLTICIRDSQFYMGEFRNLCIKEKMTELRWPQRDYIVQIARFDPAKGKTCLNVGELSQELHPQEFPMSLHLTTSSVTCLRRTLQNCRKKNILNCYYVVMAPLMILMPVLFMIK